MEAEVFVTEKLNGSTDAWVDARCDRYVSQDLSWLKAVGFPLIAGIAQFWASRVQFSSTDKYDTSSLSRRYGGADSKVINYGFGFFAGSVYVIDGVIPVDERVVNVSNSMYGRFSIRVHE
jgi:hypothetical protein